MKSEFMEVSRAFNPAEADIICSLLTGAGLNPSLFNEQKTLAIGWVAAAGGIRVMVPSAEYEKAMAVLNEAKQA